MSILIAYFIIFAIIVGFYLHGIKKNRRNWVFFDQIGSYIGLGFVIIPKYFTEEPFILWSLMGVGFLITFVVSFIGYQHRKKLGVK